jgi:hypothetical protein
MTAITFDTHMCIKRLRDKGILEAQAGAFVEVVRDAREQSLQEAATKADLRELELHLKLHIGSMIMALGGILIAIKYLG